MAVARLTSLREFARPLPLLAAALLAVNDHVLKRAGILPGWLTGKLSDVAGLFFFPILLFALAGLVRPPHRRTTRAVSLALLSGAVFTAVKVVPAVNAWVAAAWGPMVMDPTDLLALPVLAASVLYMRASAHGPPPSTRDGSRRLRGRWAMVPSAAGVLFAALASLATSAPRLPRAYPAWEVAGPATLAADCADVTPVVVKSGKEGVGVVVSLEPHAACDARVVGGRMQLGGTSFPGVIGETRRDASSGTVRAYVAFPFDNNDRWNAGERRATLDVEIATPAGPRHLAFDLFEAWPARHAPIAPQPVPHPTAAPTTRASAAALPAAPEPP